MARFSASGTDYSGNQRSRDIADEGLTRALERKARADKEKRIKESGNRSDAQKILSAAGRVGLSYLTGGASEALGVGGAVDNVLLGTDSEGNAVRNEYGDLVGAGSAIYGAMDKKKSADIAKQALLNRQQFQDRLDYADKVGGEEGAFLRAEAMDLRDRQDAQIKSAKAKNVFEFDNTFDDLGLSGTQKLAKRKRAEEARKGVGFAPSLEEMEQKGRRAQRVSYAPSLEDGMGQEGRDSQRVSYAPSLEEMEQEGSKPQRVSYAPSLEDVMEQEGRLQKIEEDRKNRIMSLPDSGPSQFEMAQIKKEKMMDDMLDREYNKKIWKRSGDYLEPVFGIEELDKSGNWEDLRNEPALMDEELSNIYGRKALGITDAKSLKEYQDAQLQGKTFSEKEAEKLSRKDSETSEMDRMADDAELKKRILNSQALDRMGERQFADFIRDISI